jgi:hypothetical protein
MFHRLAAGHPGCDPPTGYGLLPGYPVTELSDT